jgi:hypothetical protein
LKIQIHAVRALGISRISDQGVPSVFFERIQRKIERQMYTRAGIFEAMRRSLRGGVDAKARVAANVVPVSVP